MTLPLPDDPMPVVGSRQPTEPSDEQVELIDYLRVLWRYRILVVVGTLACGLAAFGITVTKPRTYEASVTLMANPSKMGPQDGPALSLANFRTLMQNRSLASQVIREFGLDKPPYRLKPVDFVGSVLRVEEVPGTNMIRVKVWLADPDLVTRVANGFAERAVDLNRRINQEETASLRDFIRDQLDQARVRMQQLEKDLLTYKRDAKVELLRKDTTALLDQRGQLLNLAIDIEKEKARLAKAEEELAKHQKTLTVRRSIDSEGALMEAARQSGDNARNVLGLELRNEYINPVYETLEQQIEVSRTSLSALERQRQELLKVFKLDATQVDQLANLYRKEIDLSKLELEYDLAKRIYTDLSTRYEQARIQVASQSTELHVIDPALPPPARVARGTIRKVMMASALGLGIFVLLAFLRDYVSRAPGGIRG